MSIDGEVARVPKPLVARYDLCRGFTEPDKCTKRKAIYAACITSTAIFIYNGRQRRQWVAEEREREREKENQNLTEGERHASSLEELLAQFYRHFPQDKQSAF